MRIQNTNVKYVYAEKENQWIYDNDGDCISNDTVNGDTIVERTYNIDTTVGLISSIVEKSYNDPYNPNDNVEKASYYLKKETSDKWLNLPYSIEEKDMSDNTRISLKTFYYNNQVEGQVIDGKCTKETEWNNNGSDAKTINVYDTYGNKSSITKANGLTTNYTTNYFITGNYHIERIETYSDGLSSTTRIDKYGKEIEKIDIYGDLTLKTYDEYGRVLTISKEIDSIMTLISDFFYERIDDNGTIYFKADAKYLDDPDDPTDKFLHVQYFKDAFGKDIQTKSEASINGIREWIVSGKNVYDSMGRLVQKGAPTNESISNNGFVDDPIESPIETYNYDDQGKLIEKTNINGLTSYFYRDTEVEYYRDR